MLMVVRICCMRHWPKPKTLALVFPSKLHLSVDASASRCCPFFFLQNNNNNNNNNKQTVRLVPPHFAHADSAC